MFLAWKEFRRGKRKKPEVQQFEFTLEDSLFQLHQELKEGAYQPNAYAAFYIQDPKLRHIHKASVRDRVLHQAVFRVLYPIFDQSFIFDSYSSRVGKGTHAAVNRLEQFLAKASSNNRRVVYALKCDISKFFDSIDHNILISLIKNKISRPDCLRLVETIIGSFQKESGKGLPLGNVTSQLFANVYLNELDRLMKHHLKARYYLRYCDDFLMLGNNQCVLAEQIPKIQAFLEQQLRLDLHPRKVLIKKYSQGIDFLGYICRPYHRLVRTNTKRRIFKRISTKNIQSYLGVVRHANGYKIRRKIASILKK